MYFFNFFILVFTSIAILFDWSFIFRVVANHCAVCGALLRVRLCCVVIPASSCVHPRIRPWW